MSPHHRRPLAEQFHSDLLSYLRGITQPNLDRLQQALDNLDYENIIQLSIHGHSHLFDILHLPNEIIQDRAQAQLISIQLLQKLIKRATLIPGALPFLLMKKSKDGFTPLHEILISGNPENMRTYFAEVKLAIKKRTIHPAELKQLLIGTTTRGFTPLHMALISGNPQNMRTYFAEIRQAIKRHTIKPAQYKKLLIGANIAGFTPLHSALKSGNPGNLRAYFAEIKQAITKNIINHTEYKQLLIGANAAGFTPLHQAAWSGNFKIYAAFTQILQRDLEVNDIKLCLEKKTFNGHLPSCQPSKPEAKNINASLMRLRQTLGSNNHASRVVIPAPKSQSQQGLSGKNLSQTRLSYPCDSRKKRRVRFAFFSAQQTSKPVEQLGQFHSLVAS